MHSCAVLCLLHVCQHCSQGCCVCLAVPCMSSRSPAHQRNRPPAHLLPSHQHTSTLALLPPLHRYTFRLTPGQVPLAVINGITMAPRHGVRVTVHARE